MKAAARVDGRVKPGHDGKVGQDGKVGHHGKVRQDGKVGEVGQDGEVGLSGKISHPNRERHTSPVDPYGRGGARLGGSTTHDGKPSLKPGDQLLPRSRHGGRSAPP